MNSFLAAGLEALRMARDAADSGRCRLALDDLRLEAPVPRPGRFLGIGGNFPRPCGPGAVSAVPRPQWFSKLLSGSSGPFDNIELPSGFDTVIHEAELAFVIGTRCRHVKRETALSMIAGYLVCNDVTVVDLVQDPTLVLFAKSFDTHGPTGPWLVTADEIADPHALLIRSSVSGEQCQSASTSLMQVRCEEMIVYLSKFLTLEPGDIVTTGSPIIGRVPLSPGDVVRCEIEGIGAISNPVVRADS